MDILIGLAAFAAMLIVAIWLIRRALFWIASKLSRDGVWRISQKGNKTIVSAGMRYTVFPSGSGWKHVATEIDFDDPIFSEKYQTEGDAIEAVNSLIEP